MIDLTKIPLKPYDYSRPDYKIPEFDDEPGAIEVFAIMRGEREMTLNQHCPDCGKDWVYVGTKTIGPGYPCPECRGEK